MVMGIVSEGLDHAAVSDTAMRTMLDHPLKLGLQREKT